MKPPTFSGYWDQIRKVRVRPRSWVCVEFVILKEMNKSNHYLRMCGGTGYCPSDLAGMEGNEELARFLVGVELDMVERIIASNTNNNAGPLPAWLDDNTSGSTTTRVSDNEQFTWEPHGGTRRMRWKLLATATATTTTRRTRATHTIHTNNE